LVFFCPGHHTGHYACIIEDKVQNYKTLKLLAESRRFEAVGVAGCGVKFKIQKFKSTYSV
jgi:hypothetical protein